MTAQWKVETSSAGLNGPFIEANSSTLDRAFTAADQSNGAMEVIPGSHLLDQIPHRDTFEKHNLLTRGQEVAVEVDERQAVRLDLQPGEMSLHHVRLVYGSAPSPSGDRRIGFAIRYYSTLS